MINAAFIIMLCAFSGMMVGLAFFRRDKERELYYRDVVKLCSIMSNNVSFKADKIGSVIGSAQIDSKALKKNMLEYEEFLSGGKLKLSSGCLKADEVARISEFLGDLGKFDGETQLNELNRRESEFGQIYDEIKQKNLKQGNMYVKLGLLIGALIGILLI